MNRRDADSSIDHHSAAKPWKCPTCPVTTPHYACTKAKRCKERVPRV